MESSPLFDLNEAIRRWRERLIQLRSFGADDLEELENHLRESVAELQAGDFSLEEAFLVASERLGSDHRLAQEYAKTNSRRIWTGRAAWVVGGVVASLVMEALATAGVGIAYKLSMWLGLNAHLVVALDFLSYWTITAAWIGLGCWLVARRNRWLVGTVSKCFRRPVWTGAALVLGLFAMQMLSHLPALWLNHSFHPAARPSPAADATTFRTWGFSAALLNRLVWVAAIPLLAAYLWKAARKVAPSIPAIPVDSVRPNERALARQLEAQGLSRAESQLVIAWQIGYRPAPAEAEARFVSGLWLERGFWMIVGMVADWMLRDFVDTPSWMLMRPGDSLPPLWQHFGGLMAICLPLALAGAAIAAFWNGATGPQQRNARMRRAFERSPVRGAMLFATLAVLWVGLTSYRSLVRPADALPPFLSYGRIWMIWFFGRVFLTDYLLPVILLVWVGNRYQAGRKSA